MKGFQPIKCQCCPHIETNKLIGTLDQLTGFYMRAALVFIGLIPTLLLVSVFFSLMKAKESNNVASAIAIGLNDDSVIPVQLQLD